MLTSSSTVENESVIKELSQFKQESDTFLTIGVFDGVHLGHQHLIKELVNKAHERKLTSGLITFKRHPLELLEPQTKITYLINLEERIKLIHALGVQFVVPLTFDYHLSRISARDFVILLRRYLRIEALLIGPDFTMGRGREGNMDFLTKLGDELGFSVDMVSPFKMEKQTVSSTAIRQFLASGDIKTANQLLSRYFSLSGIVVHGDERGKTLNFPTANLMVAKDRALPPDGVYATITIVNNISYGSVTNIGVRPTFNSDLRTIETFLFTFNGNLYGKSISVKFVDRIRSEIKFSSASELIQQIQKDIDIAKTTLAQEGIQV